MKKIMMLLAGLFFVCSCVYSQNVQTESSCKNKIEESLNKTVISQFGYKIPNKLTLKDHDNGAFPDAPNILYDVKGIELKTKSNFWHEVNYICVVNRKSNMAMGAMIINMPPGGRASFLTDWQINREKSAGKILYSVNVP